MPGIALFDLDNTLVDREGVFRSWAEWFVNARAMDPQAVDWLCGADCDGFAQREEMFSEARTRFGLKESVDQLLAEYWTDYVGFYGPDSAVVDALRGLRATGWRIAIVTNGPSTQHDKVRRAGLSELVDACCVSHEIGAQKPERLIFDEALRRCGHDRADKLPAWMVGDAPGPDIKGGREAGLQTVWMHRGRRWVEPDYRPDAQVGSVPEAVEILQRGE